MKNEPYVAPQLSLVEISVERGFAATMDDWTEDQVVVDWDDPESY